VSSTKRGGKRSEADNYPTPHWTVHRLLEKLNLPGGRWLEPGCGDGDIVKAVYDKREDVTFTGFDLRKTKFIKNAQAQPELGEFFVGNLLKPKDRLLELMSGPKFDVSIGNPPFYLAQQFIDFSLKISTHVVFLLRLNYLGSEKRHVFMTTQTPDFYSLPNRPSFRPSERGLRTTDSIEYAWFHWGEERLRSSGKFVVLNTTPKADRHA
jgi:hypothetical protein